MKAESIGLICSFRVACAALIPFRPPQGRPFVTFGGHSAAIMVNGR